MQANMSIILWKEFQQTNKYDCKTYRKNKNFDYSYFRNYLIAYNFYKFNFQILNAKKHQ